MNRIVGLSIAIVLLWTSIASASVRITEIAWMGTTESQFCEWFELYNDGGDTVNLAGWKLYEDGGNQVVFTMTKSIDSQGYLLVERNTPSCPDPVPNINDESGTFSGSGFSNSGEFLVLKDAQSAIVQSLDFSSGWPAGDVTSKETMQWNGTTWVTAPATPKAPLQGAGGGGIPPVQPAGTGTAWSAPQISPHIEISIPKIIYATLSSEYSEKVFLEYEQAYSGVFLWNMGDGTVYRDNSPVSINHTYKYPGTYTISFAYYKAPYDTKPFLFDSGEHIVTAPTIIFHTIPSKGFEFTNTDSKPFDLSGFVIALSNGQEIELPPFSIIASNKTILMPFTSFDLPNTTTKATLETPERLVMNGNQAPSSPQSNLSDKSTRPNASTGSSSLFETSNTEASALDALPETTKDQIKQKPQKIIIFAVALLIVVGLFVLIERFISSRPE